MSLSDLFCVERHKSQFLKLVKNQLDIIFGNEQEFLSLQLMRVFRLGELIWYYANTLDKAEGNLLQLNKKRIDLWANVLEGVLENKNIDYKII